MPAVWKSSPDAGGCDFACHPETPADEQSLFWNPRLQPQALRLAPATEPSEDDGAISIALARLDGLDLREADDGWHGIWRVDGISHQFWLADPMPDAAGIYEVRLPMDICLYRDIEPRTNSYTL